jgi:hypothetical protein
MESYYLRHKERFKRRAIEKTDKRKDLDYTRPKVPPDRHLLRYSTWETLPFFPAQLDALKSMGMPGAWLVYRVRDHRYSIWVDKRLLKEEIYETWEDEEMHTKNGFDFKSIRFEES